MKFADPVKPVPFSTELLASLSFPLSGKKEIQARDVLVKGLEKTERVQTVGKAVRDWAGVHGPRRSSQSCSSTHSFSVFPALFLTYSKGNLFQGSENKELRSISGNSCPQSK